MKIEDLIKGSPKEMKIHVWVCPKCWKEVLYSYRSLHICGKPQPSPARYGPREI